MRRERKKSLNFPIPLYENFSSWVMKFEQGWREVSGTLWKLGRCDFSHVNKRGKRYNHQSSACDHHVNGTFKSQPWNRLNFSPFNALQPPTAIYIRWRNNENINKITSAGWARRTFFKLQATEIKLKCAVSHKLVASRGTLCELQNLFVCLVSQQSFVKAIKSSCQALRLCFN